MKICDIHIYIYSYLLTYLHICIYMSIFPLVESKSDQSFSLFNTHRVSISVQIPGKILFFFCCPLPHSPTSLLLLLFIYFLKNLIIISFLAGLQISSTCPIQQALRAENHVHTKLVNETPKGPHMHILHDKGSTIPRLSKIKHS